MAGAKKKKKGKKEVPATPLPVAGDGIVRIQLLLGGEFRQCSMRKGITIKDLRNLKGIPDTLTACLTGRVPGEELEVSDGYILRDLDSLVFVGQLPEPRSSGESQTFDDLGSKILRGDKDDENDELDPEDLKKEQEQEAIRKHLTRRAEISPSAAIVLLERSVECRDDVGITIAVRYLKKMGIKANITVSAPYTSDEDALKL